MKVCSSCKTERDLTDYHRSRTTADGLDPRCRPCRREAGKTHKVDTMKRRTGHITRLYGLTHGDYLAMFDAQAGVCAICQQPETMTYRGNVKTLCVDHDHETGRVRGLLCAACNFALGKFQDDPARLRTAAEYLER